MNLSTMQRAILGLWSISGVGPKTVSAIAKTVSWSDVLALPVAQWLSGVRISSATACKILAVRSIEEVAEQTVNAVLLHGQSVTFLGDAQYPTRLSSIDDAPPLLFFVGRPLGSGPKRRVAVVGSRRPDHGVVGALHRFCGELVRAGAAIVSGGAEGVDQASHFGALDASGETWAFLGGAIDQFCTGPQRQLAERFLSGEGRLYSEFPPGVPAQKHTFPRRNRLISGASDAVLIARASAESGSLHTARYAVAQGRPLFAWPGDVWSSTTAGSNALLQSGVAKLCTQPKELIAAVGLEGQPRAPLESPPLEALSTLGRQIVNALETFPLDFDEITSRLPHLESGMVAATLTELELSGYVFQKPGRRYERIE
jgi:DNA processing protein